jgi:uracil-DNA glycosylase
MSSQLATALPMSGYSAMANTSILIPSTLAAHKDLEEYGAMVNIHMKWQEAQKEIAVCEECVHQWKGRVTEPLATGEIPNPPPLVRILFVGVAPTNRTGKNKGAHFYSSAADNLRRGLFRLLKHSFDVPLKDLNLEAGNAAFHRQGYFFVHAGKARPVGHDAPPEEALVFCSNRHLRKEVLFLNPRAVCFLGVNNLGTVARSLFQRNISETPVQAHSDDWTGWVALAPQPVRGGERRTALVLERLLTLVK